MEKKKRKFAAYNEGVKGVLQVGENFDKARHKLKKLNPLYK